MLSLAWKPCSPARRAREARSKLVEMRRMGVNTARRARKARPPSNCSGNAIRDPHAARAKRVLHREIAAQGTRPYAVRREVRPRPYSPVSPITLPRARSTTALYQEIAGTEGQHCSAHAGASGKRPKHGGACRRCTPRPQSVSCITEIAAQDATAGRAGRGVLPSPRTVRKVLWDDSLHFLFGAPSPAGFAITAATRTRRAGRVGMRLP